MPHNGCPHQCSFCNQKNITGQSYQPTKEDVKNILEKAVNDLGDKAQNAEIAFFGGSFTAIDRDYMITLIEAAKPYTKIFTGIRISTRPDYIDEEVLDILKKYNVTSIELGAQSMDNFVLKANNRGHNSDDVMRASRLIKSYGFSLGLQMMTGLYTSTYDKDIYTAKKFIELNPDTVRIYPTVIMKETELANLYLSGDFVPYTLEQSVDLCSKLILMFEKADIKIIRLGLHYSDSLVKNSLGNNYHPAFKELCENRIFYNSFIEKTNSVDKSKTFTVYINEKSLSKFYGQKKCNLNCFTEMGYTFEIKFDNTLEKYDLYIK
ncbi:elongator complex protein 3 [Ruminococcus sp.]|uniref:elongator complex protein 3 n=1 Tax=Ruminococcus sp. TaxID=41978 RepID=UPI003EFF7430